MSLLLHDFHVSRTELNVNREEGILEVGVHIFIDDLELALEEHTEVALYIGTKMESELADTMIEMYLKDHLKLKESDRILTWQWAGKEVTEDLSALWIYMYFETKCLGPFQISNTILLETYDDQKNIVEFYDGESRQTMLLSRQKKVERWKVKQTER